MPNPPEVISLYSLVGSICFSISNCLVELPLVDKQTETKFFQVKVEYLWISSHPSHALYLLLFLKTFFLNHFTDKTRITTHFAFIYIIFRSKQHIMFRKSCEDPRIWNCIRSTRMDQVPMKKNSLTYLLDRILIQFENFLVKSTQT